LAGLSSYQSILIPFVFPFEEVVSQNAIEDTAIPQRGSFIQPGIPGIGGREERERSQKR
jgi:hypothetical protein